MEIHVSRNTVLMILWKKFDKSKVPSQQEQGRALAVPRGPWGLNFALRKLGNL